MNFIVKIFIIISISFAIQIKFKRTFAESVSVSVMTIIMTLYVFTLFMPLTYSGYVVAGVAMAAFAYSAFYLIKNHRQLQIQSFLSFPFLFFILYCIFTDIAFDQHFAVEWDEFSHWMLVIKNMYHFDNFGVTGASTVRFSGYPPAANLFECFFNLFSSSFTEGNIYKGLNILLVSLLITPLKDYVKDFKKAFFSFFVLISVPMLLYTDTYMSLYVDCLLGIMFARLVYIGFSEEKYDLFFIYNFAMSSAVLVLTKAAGMGLYLFAVLALFVDIFFFSRELAINGLNVKNKILKLITWCSVLIVPFIADRSWKLYLRVNELRSAWNTSGVTFKSIFELFTDNIPEYRVSTLTAFADAYFNMNEFGDIGLKCSYFLYPIIFTLMMFIVSLMGSNKRRVKCLNIVLSISYILYTISLLILYLFTYSQYEAENVASFSRYMGTITLGYLLVVVICLLNPSAIHRNVSNNKNNTVSIRKINIAIVIVTLFLCSVELKDLFILKARRAENQTARANAGHIYGLYGLFDYETDKVYYIAQGSLGYDYWRARYALTPVSINPNFSWALANAPSEGDLWTKEMTVQEWSDDLKENYTYVYLEKIDEQFCEDFGELFEDPDNILEKTIYKIEVNEQDDLVTLVPFWF
ncbi:MAG: hypothetical protein HDR03_05305 [Lachnospiraceae bacterium]|nr:hypothetical protein [Lachnospiraceae bacterium]